MTDARIRDWRLAWERDHDTAEWLLAEAREQTRAVEKAWELSDYGDGDGFTASEQRRGMDNWLSRWLLAEARWFAEQLAARLAVYEPDHGGLPWDEPLPANSRGQQ